MKPDTMRAIDYWAGVPLTFLATALWRLWQAVAGRPAPAKPRRVLFVELSEMGSTILADPAMRKAREALGAELFFVIFRKNRPSLNLLHTIPPENIFEIDERSLPALASGVLAFRYWAKNREIDAVVDLELFSRFSALLCWMSGAAHKVGFDGFHNEGLYRGGFFTRRVAYNPHQHIAKNFVALVNALVAERPEAPYSKTVVRDDEIVLPVVTRTEAELAAMREKIRAVLPGYDAARHRIVLVNPNSSMLLPQRRWPQERYVQLVGEILGRHADVVVLVTGAPDEAEEAWRFVARVASPRCASLAGTMIIEELPTLYLLSALMVTNDSGPGHFSAITPMPTLVLFGPETPALYGSLGERARFLYAGLACSPCVSAANHRKTSCTANACMEAITVEMAVARVEEMLASESGRSLTGKSGWMPNHFVRTAH